MYGRDTFHNTIMINIDSGLFIVEIHNCYKKKIKYW